MCEWRLGREALVSTDGTALGAGPNPVTLKVIVACLKRIRKSIRELLEDEMGVSILRGERAVVKDVGTPVSIIIGYAQLGLAPEDFAEEVHAALVPALVYDALSYYHDHRAEIDREISENTDEALRIRLAEQMRSPEDYHQITGQRG